MREILFRGKCPHNDEWAYGYAILTEDKAFILNNATVEFRTGYNENRLNFVLQEIIPESIGQFTGICDKNGTKVFEGDIIASDLYTYIIRMGEYKPNNIYYITDNCECNVGKIYGVFAHCIEDKKFNCIIPVSSKSYQIIGNIYDNPELLKERKK